MYLGSQLAADGRCERNVVHGMNVRYKALGALKRVLSDSGLWINWKKCQYEGMIVPTALH